MMMSPTYLALIVRCAFTAVLLLPSGALGQPVGGKPGAQRRGGDTPARPGAAAEVAPGRAHTGASGSETFKLTRDELALSDEALAVADRHEIFARFSAREDHVLESAQVHLRMDQPHVEGFTELRILLNGERVASLPLSAFEALDSDGTLEERFELDAEALAGSNILTLQLRTGEDADTCARIPRGTWRALRELQLELTSTSLPLADDLAALPLPFVDPTFSPEQEVHFVLPGKLSTEKLRAAALVASWFALSGQGKLSFHTTYGSLPDRSAIVLLDDLGSFDALGIQPPDKLGEHGIVQLVSHPEASARKLLVIAGHDPKALENAARGLLRHGYELTGAARVFDAQNSLPVLEDFEVPRWARAPGNIRLGDLPGKPELRLSGGRSGSVRVPLRVPPDLFVWPADYVVLDLGYAQGISPAIGPARLHVAWNGASLRKLPPTTEGRVTLRIPRRQLRGFNELLLQVSYDETGLDECADQESDSEAWVAIDPESTLRLGNAHRFTMVPDISLFLYDGYPFTSHGDLRASAVLLPATPKPREVSTMLGVLSHFSTITGAAPSGVHIDLGHPGQAKLRDRDVLVIATEEKHALLRSLHERLPLVMTRQMDVQRPKGSLIRRLLMGRLGDSEIERARAVFNGEPLTAAFGIAAPWDSTRSIITLTATDSEHLPNLAGAVAFAEGVEKHNDVWIEQGDQRYLFSIGTPRSSGDLPPLLEGRLELARYWVLLVLAILLAGVLAALGVRDALAAKAKRRLAVGWDG